MNQEDKEFEIDRPHGAGRLYNFLINHKSSEASKVLPFSDERLICS